MVQWQWIMCFAYQSSWPWFMWGDWRGTSLRKCWSFWWFALWWVSLPASALSSLYGHLYWLSFFTPSPWHWCMFLIMYLVGRRPNTVSYVSTFYSLSMNMLLVVSINGVDFTSNLWLQFWLIRPIRQNIARINIIDWNHRIRLFWVLII